jgi:hypothetical protein
VDQRGKKKPANAIVIIVRTETRHFRHFPKVHLVVVVARKSSNEISGKTHSIASGQHDETGPDISNTPCLDSYVDPCRRVPFSRRRPG